VFWCSDFGTESEIAMEYVDAFAIFAKVGELESISGAARALGLPKANVSRAVSRLESTYKVNLLDRSTRRVALTEVGRTLHGYCLKVADDMEEAGALIAAHRGIPAGTLRIGCSADVGRDLISPYLQEFLERYPEIDLRIRVGERLMPTPGGIDVVLHSGWLSDSRLIVRKVANVQTFLVASRRYVDMHGTPQNVEECAEHAIIGNFYLDPASAEIGRLPAHVPILELVRENERHPVPIWKRFASTDHSMMLSLVEQGLAIAPISASRSSEKLRSGDFVRILPEYEIHNQPVLYALSTERTSMSPKLKVFIDFVNEMVSR
jgi:LysR family transcriptional regulator, transcriptional activator for aaeXAB operon